MMMAFTAVKKTSFNIGFEKNQCERKSMVWVILSVINTKPYTEIWSTLLYFFQNIFKPILSFVTQTFPYQLFPSAHPLAYFASELPSPGGGFAGYSIPALQYGFLNLSNF